MIHGNSHIHFHILTKTLIVKTHLLPRFISAILLLCIACVGQIASAASFKLKADQITQISQSPKYAQQILTENPKVAPADVAVAIAEPLGSKLNAQAPQIAAAMVESIISKGITPATEHQAADVVATFASLLNGTPQEKTTALTALGKAVADVVKASGSTSSTTLAKNIVGTTLTNLKFGASGADAATLSAFADPFKTGNPTTDAAIAAIVTGVSSGQAYNAVPASPAVLNNDPAINTGNTTKPESNTGNVTPTPTPPV